MAANLTIANQMRDELAAMKVAVQDELDEFELPPECHPGTCDHPLRLRLRLSNFGATVFAPCEWGRAGCCLLDCVFTHLSLPCQRIAPQRCISLDQ